MNKSNPAQRRTPRPAQRRTPRPARRTRGQALIIVGLAMVVLMLFIGLGVDVGFIMSKKAKLQSAVDTAALSAAQILYEGTEGDAYSKGMQILEANDVLSNTLDLNQTTVDFPGVNQAHVSAVQHVDTFFMRLLPAFSSVDIFAEATADATSYAEIPTKPYGTEGVVNELNLSVWGKDSKRQNGDAYSPLYYSPSHVTLGQGTAPTNPNYIKQPYGYLYRIDVPASYPANTDLVVQIFDPDTYNRNDTPPTPYVAGATPTPTWTPDMYVYCAGSSSTCTTNSGGVRENTALKLNAFPNGLTGFWRVDEIRGGYWDGSDTYADSKTNTTKYTLWHFSPHNTTAFGDPNELSDYFPNGGTAGGPIATYIAANSSSTDLRWYQPPNFRITPSDFAQEVNGKYYFYLYIQGTTGSSENNFDLRVGPPSSSPDCSSLSGGYTSPCYVNSTYKNAASASTPIGSLWNTGGAVIFAKRALPLNLDTGTAFPMLLAQISRNAAGQILGVRHFDQDCNGGCGPTATMNYQMQLCGQTDLNAAATWGSSPVLATGYIGGNDLWVAGGGSGNFTPLIFPGTVNDNYPSPEKVTIPDENSAYFKNGGTTCDTSWLRIQSYPSAAQDTTVWELPFLRPRLVR